MSSCGGLPPLAFVYRGCQREFPSIVELQLSYGGGAGGLVGPETPGSGLSGERCLARTRFLSERSGGEAGTDQVRTLQEPLSRSGSGATANQCPCPGCRCAEHAPWDLQRAEAAKGHWIEGPAPAEDRCRRRIGA